MTIQKPPSHPATGLVPNFRGVGARSTASPCRASSSISTLNLERELEHAVVRGNGFAARRLSCGIACISLLVDPSSHTLFYSAGGASR